VTTIQNPNFQCPWQSTGHRVSSDRNEIVGLVIAIDLCFDSNTLVGLEADELLRVFECCLPPLISVPDII
jgi:hypothetical protein